MELSILAQQFYEHSSLMKGYTKDTIRRYKYAINRYCTISKVTRIDQVTEENVRALLYYGRTVRQWKPSTYIVIHKSLLIFFRWCIANGHLKDNPVTNIEKPKLEKRLPANLSKQDAFRLLEIVYNYPYAHRFERYRNHALFSMAVFAGLRKQELLHLRLTDVDIENRTIFVHQGKGSKDRIVPMSHTLAQTLSNYVTERKRLNKSCPEFFTSLHNNVGFNDTGMKRLVDMIRVSSGMKFTIHKLRHTFATLMLEGGCDIYSLSRMMGHSDINTTTIYLSASAEHLRSQIIKHPLNNIH